jgi:hypothetical protein
MTISIRNNEIIWFDKTLTKFCHKPISTSFQEIEVLNNGNIVVLEEGFNYSNDKKSNVYCLNRKMEILWYLDTPNSNRWHLDLYVGFSTNGEELFANSFSCYRVQFTENGQILNTWFTK